MTSTDDLWQRAENELRSTKTLSESTRDAMARTAPERRHAFAEALKVAGFDSPIDETNISNAVPELDRLCAARLMLLAMRLDSDAPAWSSWMLDRALEGIATLPGGSIGDLFRSLHALLGERNGELTRPIAGFIKDAVIRSFSQHRESYEFSDWTWLVLAASQPQTPAQAYLALLALGPSFLSPEVAVGILRNLADTTQWDSAIAALDDTVKNATGHALLKRWQAEGVPSSRAADVERLLAWK